jgi:hypothetical protein
MGLSKDEWQPIETAPNDESILVAYESGYIDCIRADSNRFAWQRPTGPRVEWADRPTHWMPLPEAPE